MRGSLAAECACGSPCVGTECCRNAITLLRRPSSLVAEAASPIQRLVAVVAGAVFADLVPEARAWPGPGGEGSLLERTCTPQPHPQAPPTHSGAHSRCLAEIRIHRRGVGLAKVGHLCRSDAGGAVVRWLAVPVAGHNCSVAVQGCCRRVSQHRGLRRVDTCGARCWC
jgi:hypothetical protein